MRTSDSSKKVLISDEDGGSPNERRQLPMGRERGFVAMSPAANREIAKLGGRAAHAGGNAHEFTSEEARSAGRKGGLSVSADRDHMAEIGRVGGRRRWLSGPQPNKETVS